jgi:allantoinase
VLDGKVDWIVSDHACCAEEVKGAGGGHGDVWLAKAGFGGTEYLLAGVFSEGRKRGLPLHRMAELLALNPARRYGLLHKGDVAVGLDAPFEGQELTGRVTATFLRGSLAWEHGRAVGPARGRYIRRPA